MTLERPSAKEAWGFKIIGGKDQSLTVKVGNVKPYSYAEKAGLQTMDYIWQINGKEVFELGHKDCVAEIKNSGNTLKLATERYIYAIYFVSISSLPNRFNLKCSQIVVAQLSNSGSHLQNIS